MGGDMKYTFGEGELIGAERRKIWGTKKPCKIDFLGDHRSPLSTPPPPPYFAALVYDYYFINIL